MHPIGIDFLDMVSMNDFVRKPNKSYASSIGCESKRSFLEVALLELYILAKSRVFHAISIIGRKCLCVCGNVVLWSKYFDIRVLVPMFYLELFNHIRIYI